MKALSVRQPWAWLIVNGYKDIENRTWPTKYRGRVLIHASKGMTAQEYEDAMDFILHVNGIQAIHRMPGLKEFERGGIVGVATVSDCVPSARRTSRWHIDGAFGFRLDDAKPLPFVACKGALGFFDIPRDAADALHALAASDSPEGAQP